MTSTGSGHLPSGHMLQRKLKGSMTAVSSFTTCLTITARLLQVKCTECGHESNTYDTFLDLSLEINRASDLTRALQRFTGSEYLDGANKYICPKQKRKVRAAKCMTVEQAPAVLVIQLKRFEFSMFGHKINKKVG